MSRKQTRRLGRFDAHDAKGKQYTVVVTQEFTESTTNDGTEWIPGFKTLQTADGSHVNVRDGKLFMLGLAGEVPLEPDDPGEWKRFA